MSTTDLLHGLRIAQHLVTEAASYGIKFSTITTQRGGDLTVHLDKTDGPAFASHLVDTLGLDVIEVNDCPDHTTPFRSTVVIYRGTTVTIYGSLPVDQRPEPPEYTATDVTGWEPDEIADMQARDDETEANYQARLTAWLACHPEAAVSA